MPSYAVPEPALSSQLIDRTEATKAAVWKLLQEDNPRIRTEYTAALAEHNRLLDRFEETLKPTLNLWHEGVDQASQVQRDDAIRDEDDQLVSAGRGVRQLAGKTWLTPLTVGAPVEPIDRAERLQCQREVFDISMGAQCHDAHQWARHRGTHRGMAREIWRQADNERWCGGDE